MKKNAIVAGILCVAALLFLTGAYMLSKPADIAKNASDGNAPMPEEDRDTPAGMADSKETYYITPHETPEAFEPYKALYDAAASPDETRLLDELVGRDKIFVYPREAMTAVGMLPPDQARITLEQVEACVNAYGGGVYNQDNPTALREALDAIHGAADCEGGSGVYRVVYYLTDDRLEQVGFFMGVNGFPLYTKYGRDGTLLELYYVGDGAPVYDASATTTPPRADNLTNKEE